MKLEYTLTLAHYKAAQRLHIRQKLSRRIGFLVWFVVVPILAAIGLAAYLFFDIYRYTHFAAQLFGVECGLIWIALFLPILREYQIRKTFKHLFPSNRTDRRSTLEIDDEQIISSIPGVSEGKFFWPGITGFAQDEKISLIYVATRRFLFFPTSAMNSAQQTELSGLVAHHVGKR